MRGSSSPVELRHQLSELPGPSSVPSRTVDLPVDSKPVFSPEDGEDLEEGEVISPVRRPLPVETTGLPRGPGDRWTPSDRRRSVSPRKPLFRSRPVSPDYRDRDRIGSRDRNWDRDRDRDRERDGRPRDRRFDLQQQQRRSLSPEIIRPKFERHDSAGIPGGRHLDRSPAVSTDPAGGSAGTSGVLSAPTPPAPSVAPPAHSHSPPRPSTPPIPSPVDRTAAVQDTAIINVGSTPAPARPDTPLLPDIPAAPPPSTSPLTVLDTSPAVPTHTPATEGSTIERPRTPELPETAPTVDETPDRQEEQEQGESQGPLKNEEQEVAQRTSVVTAAAKTGLFSSSTLTTLPDSHETVRGPASDTSSASTPKRAPTPPLHVRVRSNLVYGEPSSSNVALDQPRDEAHASTGKQVADEGARNGTDGVNASVQFAELPTNLSPTSLRVTIAERRSVKLPDTAVPLSSPFGERIRKDSMPTAGSAHTSTDAETDDGLRTADIRDEPHSADLSDGALEALFEKQVAAAVEAQLDDWQADFDPDVVYAWNLKVADSPPPSPRAWDLQDRIDRVTWDMDATHDHVAKLVSIKVERDEAEAAEHIQTLQAQYRDLHQQWQAQCDILKAQMSKRAPLPAVWSALPGDPLVDLPSQQPTTPGLLPGTLAFDDTRARVNRRRGGVADVVNSDEELNQAIARSLREDELNPITLAHKTLATVPDMLPEAERRVRYDDENDLVKDPLVFYDFAGTQGPIWTAEEREVFRRAYPNSAKQFGKIANKLPNKTVADCVQYYYRTKKELDWKSQARRGGDRRRNRAPVVKKPGKSSALMADLGRQKPTINPNARGPGAGAGVGGKTTVTPGRPGKGRVSAIAGAGAAATPSDPAGSKRRKPTVDAATIDGVSSEAPSRAGSEVPGTAAKAKMRMSIKGKRPRQSSMTGLTSTDPLALAAAANPAFATPAMASDGAAPAPPTDGSSSSNPQAELLPPAKRAGKRRKVVGADGASAADSPGVPGLNGTGTANGTGEKTDKPRRSATNSYWSVDEKKLVLRLFAEYGDDTERIATHIAGKSVRQVQNFLATRSADPSAFAAAVGAVAGGDGPVCRNSLITLLGRFTADSPIRPRPTLLDTTSTLLPTGNRSSNNSSSRGSARFPRPRTKRRRQPKPFPVPAVCASRPCSTTMPYRKRPNWRPSTPRRTGRSKMKGWPVRPRDDPRIARPLHPIWTSTSPAHTNPHSCPRPLPRTPHHTATRCSTPTRPCPRRDLGTILTRITATPTSPTNSTNTSSGHRKWVCLVRRKDKVEQSTIAVANAHCPRRGIEAGRTGLLLLASRPLMRVRLHHTLVNSSHPIPPLAFRQSPKQLHAVLQSMRRRQNDYHHTCNK